MKRAIVLVVLALTACGSPSRVSSPTQTGEPFLPAYLAMLQGRGQPGDDRSCPPPVDLKTLLIPCDTAP